MAVAIRTITRVQDADDAPALGAGQQGYALTWNNATGAFVATPLFTGGLLATGATTGATSQAQAFTNGVVTGVVKPAADSTSAVQLQTSGGTAIVTLDTTNRRIGVGKTPDALFDLVGNIQTNPIASFLNKNDDANWAPVRFGQAMADGSNEFGLNIGSYNASGNKILRWQLYGSPTRWDFTTGADDILSFAYRFLAQAGFMGAYHTDLDIVLNQHTNGGPDTAIRFKNNGGSSTAMSVMETGRVGIGTSSPSTILHALATDAGTNAVVNVATLGHDTSGTAAAGFGAGLAFQLESSTTAAQNAARVRALWYEATHATCKADLVGTAYDAGGEREGWRVRGNGSAPAIGFLGATPQARIAHVADPSGGATVDTEARSAINSILSTLELFGFHAAS